MKTTLFKVTALATAISLAGVGCSNMTPGENAALFGSLSAVAVGVPLALAGVDPNITVPIAAGAGVLAGATAFLIAKHQATVEQRRIAEARALAYLARVQREQARQIAASRVQPQAAPIEVPRYIAVATAPSENYKSQSAVMVYDTQRQALVGNDVYELKSAPKVGTVSKYDTIQATYVGAGEI
ncbi:MAG: hypothetical protein N2035_06920 [Chthoniobacterales bacterium]|nr:hypothetical protein [Chthoniobacterales bacterium]